MSKALSNPVALVRQPSGSNDPMLPTILEFQWPSTAIVNAPVPRSARYIVWIIASMVVTLMAVLGLIPVDRVVTARGIVVSQSPTILLQPLDTAIVRSIDVRDGQEVRAGQVLARLDPTFATADVATLEAQASSHEAEVARLQAEAAGQPFDYVGLDPNRLLQAAIYAHQKAEFDAKLENYARRNDELASVISRSQSDAAGYRERLGVAEELEHMNMQLQSMQVGSRAGTLAAIDNRAEMERSLANAEQTAAAAGLDRAALDSERDAYVQNWRANVGQSLAEANAKASDVRAQLNKAKLHRQMVELRSDRNAIVQSVAKVSVGSVLQSGQQFITLVPADAPLEVEANISGREDGFVHVGDPVAVKFDTFPYSQYGMAKGTVRMVSPDAFTAQDEARNPTSSVRVAPTSVEPFYRTRIAINRMALHDVPVGFHVTPGMPVTADIKVGKRTVLKFLLGSLMPVAQEGMREP
jgi:membrane fusion protein, hemolysin D